MWLVRIPVAACLAVFLQASIRSVWLVMVLDWIARVVLLTWRYRRVSWGRIEL
jgi:Na+-driven multidrug efflux pump